MSAPNWKAHLSVLIVLASVIFAIGWQVGRPLLTLFVALVIYLGWHLLNLWRLGRWLANVAQPPPAAIGLWGNIFYGIGSVVRRKEKAAEHYRSVIGDFTDLAHAFPDAAIVIDTSDRISWFNHAAQALLELKDPEDLGQPLTNFIRGPDFANWLTVQPEVRSPLELQAPGTDDRWLNATSVTVRDGQRLIVLRDTTEVHNVEQIRRDFVANISHELRTPLTVLTGYLEILEGHDADDVSTVVGKMLHQTTHMQSMLDDLLELSRLQSDKIDEEEDVVDMPAILMQLQEQAEELSRGQHRLEWSVDRELKINGIASDLESAISNLINNAIKYTPEGGTIRVSWTMGSTGPVLTVQDTGIGIPRRDIPRITERFYRVGSDRGRRTGGTGLGLAIVKHVLNAHQATLSIESALGEGSTFRCHFRKERARRSNRGTAS